MNGITPEQYQEAATTFRRLREQLPQESREDIVDILTDVPIDPSTATVEQAWRVVWDKPLFTNSEVCVATRRVLRLAPHMPNAWEYWGQDRARFLITHQGGRDANENFSVAGTEALTVRESANVPVPRLFRIQNAAKAMRSRVERHGKHPVQDFAGTPIEQLVPALVAEFGRGWGPATVLHMLTDFGVAVKPDLHLTRTMRHLGLWHGDNDAPNVTEAIEIANRVRKLAEVLGDADASPHAFRRLDLELMHVSLYGLLDRNAPE